MWNSCYTTQHLLPTQTGLYQYDEWMEQDINDKNFDGSLLTELNGS